MARTLRILDDTTGQTNVTGQPFRADGWYGMTNSFYTIAIYVVNFTGRFYLEASLATNPTIDDWFPINLNGEIPFLQYPLNPNHPTSESQAGLALQGDTQVDALNFQANISWIRARVDRTYFQYLPTDPDQIAELGSVKQAILSF